MKRFNPFVTAAAAVVLVGLACSSESAVQNARSTRDAQEVWLPTLTAVFAQITPQPTERAGSREGEPTPEDCFRSFLTGDCLSIGNLVPSFPSVVIGPTPPPDFVMPTPILRVRAVGWADLSSEPGEGFSAQVRGRIPSRFEWDVHLSVSGFPEGSDTQPLDDPSAGHYFGSYLEGWLEKEIDLGEGGLQTRCIDHDWEHPDECHAHLYDSQGGLIAQLDERVAIVKVIGEDPTGTLINVIVELLWVSRDNVQILEEYGQ